MIRTQVSSEDKRTLPEPYEATHSSVDEPPYASDFERLFAAFRERETSLPCLGTRFGACSQMPGRQAVASVRRAEQPRPPAAEEHG